MEHTKDCGCHLCWEPPITDDRKKAMVAEGCYCASCEQLAKELKWEQDKNDFDAKRLRRLALLLGIAVPESDETLLGCAGTVIGQACAVVEKLFAKTPND